MTPDNLLDLCRDHPQMFANISAALADEVKDAFAHWVANGDLHAVEWVVENTVVAHAIRIQVGRATGSSPIVPWPLVELEALARFFAVLRLVGRG